MGHETEKRFLSEFNPNQGIVHRVCNAYFTDPEVRRDVFQEIVYQLWKSYPAYRQDSKFTTWMYKVALNTAITYRRRRQRSADEHSDRGTAPDVPDHSDTHPDEEQLSQLYRAIHLLSAGDKAIILLYLEDHTYEEIAAVTGLTKSHVSVKLVRIKKILEEKLSDNTNNTSDEKHG